MLKKLITVIAILLMAACNGKGQDSIQSFDAKVFFRNGMKTKALVEVNYRKTIKCSFDNGTQLDIELNQVGPRTQAGPYDFIPFEGTSNYFDAEILIFYNKDEIKQIRISPYESSQQDILLENDVKKL